MRLVSRWNYICTMTSTNAWLTGVSRTPLLRPDNAVTVHVEFVPRSRCPVTRLIRTCPRFALRKLDGNAWTQSPANHLVHSLVSATKHKPRLRAEGPSDLRRPVFQARSLCSFDSNRQAPASVFPPSVARPPGILRQRRCRRGRCPRRRPLVARCWGPRSGPLSRNPNKSRFVESYDPSSNCDFQDWRGPQSITCSSRHRWQNGSAKARSSAAPSYYQNLRKKSTNPGENGKE